MKREYQLHFSDSSGAMFDAETRKRKARTMVAVLEDYLGPNLQDLDLLDVGSSTGIIDEALASSFHTVVGLDIDNEAVQHASRAFSRVNLFFQVGDATSLAFRNGCLDVVICSQVYEHVPDAAAMIGEIFRVLKPGGVCYFAAGNRLVLIEPHYGLPLLSVIPRPMAHVFIRLSGRARHYHELHLSYFGLRRLVRCFEVCDYTARLISSPEQFHTGYMIHPGSIKSSIALFVARYLRWMMPGYVWILSKC
jgi:ubiquinone/menaquinone biosynthesis C-methylase UbiE